MIPYSRQTIQPDDIREVVKTLKSPFLTQGPKVKEFEAALSKYTGAKYAIAFANGTTALHAAYFAAGVRQGDEVVMPALTFAATGNAALYLGAQPVFVDIDIETGNIDASAIEKSITQKTKALIAVDYAGLPADLDEVRAVARKHKLVFIEDAAQGLGAIYKKKRLGTLADMTMFSFHPVKSITTGEGGAILTDDKRYYDILMMFRTHGMTRDPERLQDVSHAAWHQEMHVLGNNYRLTDIHAALGVSQMRKLEKFVAKRRTFVRRYEKILANIPYLIIPHSPKDRESAWHLYVVRLAPDIAANRDKIFTELRKRGIGVQVHYLPVYLHPYYQKLGYKKGICPNAEEFADSCLSIPLFPTMTNKEQDFVAKTLADILKKYEA